jgi:hypothetical protein
MKSLICSGVIVLGFVFASSSSFALRSASTFNESRTFVDANSELSLDSNIVSGRSKPASQGRIKTSQFEGIIIGQGAHQDETLTGEPSQIEPATIDINSAPGGMVQPGYCA